MEDLRQEVNKVRCFEKALRIFKAEDNEELCRKLVEMKMNLRAQLRAAGHPDRIAFYPQNDQLHRRQYFTVLLDEDWTREDVEKWLWEMVASYAPNPAYISHCKEIGRSTEFWVTDSFKFAKTNRGTIYPYGVYRVCECMSLVRN